MSVRADHETPRSVLYSTPRYCPGEVPAPFSSTIYDTSVTESRNTRMRKSETMTESLTPADEALRPSIACPNVMSVQLEGAKEKYVLFARIGALVQGGTSRSSTKAYGSHGAITGARSAMKMKARTTIRPIHVSTAGRLRRSSRSGKSTRPMIECRGTHALIESASVRRGRAAIAHTYRRMRGSMSAPTTSMTRLMTTMIVA